jgi:hypothetical protein
VKLIISVLIALSACGGEMQEPKGLLAPTTLTGPGGCADPATYGGIPNDAADDRPAIQAAIDAVSSAGGGRVCLGPGRWIVTKAPVGSYNRFAALTIHAPKVELSGDGPGTTIEMSGDQALATVWTIALDPGAVNVTLRDFVIDTSGMTNTHEQTHAIEVGSGVGVGPVTDVRIERLIINHPQGTNVRKGDCLRLVGATAASYVRRVTVIGSSFLACARSGIAIQRGVHDLVVVGNQFTEASDQDIDAEPSADGGNSGLTIVGNIFRDNPVAAQGDWSVALAGYGVSMDAVTLANNVFEGRGVVFNRMANTVVSGNTFNATMETGYGVLNFENDADSIVITGNAIRRRGFAGPLIRIMPAGGNHAKRISIGQNEMVQETNGNGIHLESVTKLGVVANGIEWTTPNEAPTAVGLYLRTTISEADSVIVANNRWVGPMKYVIQFGALPLPFKAVSVTGNLATAATNGLRCDQSVAGSFQQPIVFAANNFNSASQCTTTPLVGARP